MDFNRGVDSHFHRPDSPDYPRLLIATGFPPCSAGGGAWILDQLMRDIPPGHVAWWSQSGTLPPTAKDRVGLFRNGGLPKRLEPHRRLVEIKTSLLQHFWVPSAARELRNFIIAQKPDRLWLIPHAWSLPVIHRAVRDLGIPWHISIHDFPYAAPEEKSWQGSFQGMLDELYAGAASRDVIGPEMASYMEERTGCKADAFFRCSLEPEELEYVRTKTFSPIQDKIIIGYPGTIIAEDTFTRFLTALKSLRNRLPLPVEVHLFTGHSYKDRPWFDPGLIIEKGFLYEKDLEAAYRQCHWGLAIMPLEESNPRYSRYSFPCKFTKPLTSGIPLICVGHQESSLIRLASNYRLGPVITSLSAEDMISALFPALSTLACDPLIRSEILRCAEEQFNAQRNREFLKKLLRRSV